MKRSIAILLAFVLTLSSVPRVYAEEITNKNEQLRNTIYKVVALMKKTFNDDYERLEEEIKELIVEKGYDYNMSMDSFYDQANPLKNAEYINYLAAYMSCKKYAKEKGKTISWFQDIEFFTYEVKENEFEEYVPTTIDKYVQDDIVLDEFHKVGTTYILEPTEVPIYEQQQNGKWKKTKETELITPDTKTTTYIDISLSVIKPEEIFKYFGIDENLVDDDYEKRAATIRKIISNNAINQTINLKLPEINLDDPEISKYTEGLEGINKIIVQTALSLKGRIPYEWGGKPQKPGYDNSWWSYNETNGLQRGLDCSGFVKWSYMTSGFPKEVYSKLESTSTILNSDLERISKEELRPGDIGCTNRINATNHVGIYVGDDMWVHCSSTKKGVTVSKVDFTVFFRPYSENTQIDESIITAYNEMNDYTYKYNISNYVDTQNSVYYTLNYNCDDALLLAKLIYHEARGEGLNGWIGVGEVVLNRMNSDLYPNTVQEVIYQEGQFTDNEQLESINPSEEMITAAQMILSGKLKVFDNPQVMYFKNPMITNGIEATIAEDWGLHKYFTYIEHHAFYLQ